jgi:hypothetical protein
METPADHRVADQLVDEVMLRLSRLAALLPGLDVELDRRCREMRAAASGLADQLAREGPTAWCAAATISMALFGDDGPQAPIWWQTPLGRAVAISAEPRPAAAAPDTQLLDKHVPRVV